MKPTLFFYTVEYWDGLPRCAVVACCHNFVVLHDDRPVLPTKAGGAL